MSSLMAEVEELRLQLGKCRHPPITHTPPSEMRHTHTARISQRVLYWGVRHAIHTVCILTGRGVYRPGECRATLEEQCEAEGEGGAELCLSRALHAELGMPSCVYRMRGNR